MGLSLLLLVFSLIFTVVSRLLLLKAMGCFSGCLMSSAGIQKLFCGIYLVFKCSFHEFVGGESGLPVLFLRHLRTASEGEILKVIHPLSESLS